MRRLILAVVLMVAGVCSLASAATPITVSIDATDVSRRLFHSTSSVPVPSGPCTLVFAKWIPGTHSPAGMIQQIAGLKFSAGGKPIAWHRDLVDMYAFHCDVPEGASAVDVAMDFVAPAEGNFLSENTTASTADVAIVHWESLMLYPQGAKASDVTVQASIKLPAGWDFATPLPQDEKSENQVKFSQVSLYTLVDSPVLAGRHFKKIKLSSGSTPLTELDLAADDEANLEIRPQTVDAYKHLVTEAGKLFGTYHYSEYHFLVTLSDPLIGGGLEHHQCSEDRMRAGSFVDGPMVGGGSLLPHEYVHSWNGKYRRPAGLATSDYQQPMKDDLLWVYEGLTEYYGEVLTARSGLNTQRQFRQRLANLAAALDNEPGRGWRPLADTAIAAQLDSDGHDFESWRRGLDYYDEGVLIWLDADTLIRKQTGEKKSLDDFCKLFHGGKGGPPELKTYELADVVAALNDVAPYDWAKFFDERVTQVSEHAPLAGLQRAGWKLIYADTQDNNDRPQQRRRFAGGSFPYSLGFAVNMEGQIVDVTVGKPAFNAGLSAGMKLVAVNMRQFSANVLRDALLAAEKSKDPIELLIQAGEHFKIYKLDYHDGPRYPRLERVSAQPDLLAKITRQSDILEKIIKSIVPGPATAPATQPASLRERSAAIKSDDLAGHI